MYVGLHVKYPLFMSYFIETWISRQIFEKYSISNFMTIRPETAELFHADGQAEITTSISITQTYVSTIYLF